MYSLKCNNLVGKSKKHSSLNFKTWFSKQTNNAVQYLGSFDNKLIFIQFLHSFSPNNLFRYKYLVIYESFNIPCIYCFPVLMLSPCVLQHVHNLAVFRFWMFSYYGMSTLIHCYLSCNLKCFENRNADCICVYNSVALVYVSG